MPDEDRCQHGMIRRSCSYCQAEPEYKIEKTKYRDIIEIKHNGNSITEFDKNFMFGRDKARLFLACIDIVEELAAAQGDELPHIRNREFVDLVGGDRIFVRVESFFERSDGRRVNVPWIHLQSSKNPDISIGFGRRKAKAIFALRRKIARWANYPLADR
ncbi:MAG: hypothetical protein ABSG44_21710 [Thermodesulfobacteriota bacterium]